MEHELVGGRVVCAVRLSGVIVGLTLSGIGAVLDNQQLPRIFIDEEGRACNWNWDHTIWLWCDTTMQRSYTRKVTH